MVSSRVLRRIAPLVATLAAPPLADSAMAQERAAELMSEPIGYTAVADAFDGGDLFDANVHLGFRRSVAAGTIQREQIGESSEDGRSSRHYVAVAEHEHVRNELVFQLDLGIYHDLMLYVRIPVVLGDDRELQR